MFLPFEEAGIRFDEKRVISYEPFMGTMGVGPQIEAVNALTPDYYGGTWTVLKPLLEVKSGFRFSLKERTFSRVTPTPSPG